MQKSVKKARMTHFADALRSALAEMDWKPGELERRSKSVTRPTLSRYLSGEDLPKTSTLDLICLAFPEDLRQALVSAYLLDQIPPSAKKLVGVTSVQEDGVVTSVHQPGKPVAGSELEEIFSILAGRAIYDRNLYIVLAYLADKTVALYEQEGEDDLGEFSVEERARLEAAQKQVEARVGKGKGAERVRYDKTNPKRSKET